MAFRIAPCGKSSWRRRMGRMGLHLWGKCGRLRRSSSSSIFVARDLKCSLRLPVF